MIENKLQSSKNIEIGVTGKILEGMHTSSYIRIEQDFENAERYLILISKDIDFASTDGCDYWVEKYESLMAFFEKSKWKIQWQNN